jgi:hypothetical protein
MVLLLFRVYRILSAQVGWSYPFAGFAHIRSTIGLKDSFWIELLCSAE